MGDKQMTLTVFTKPWTEPLPELARKVRALGFDGVELPVRPGYQVEPDMVGKGLPEAARILREEGLKIGSVAGPTDEATIAACGAAGAPMIRVCEGIDMKVGYLASEKRIRERYDALLPALERHGVAIGVQNHCDYCVGSAIGMMHLIEGYDPARICAVLDPAHCAVDGEPEDMAIDICWSHLRLVNFKSAFHRRVNGPEEVEARYAIHWTTCHHSGFSWSKAIRALLERGYRGDLCLPAEYTNLAKGGQLMGDEVIRPLKIDLDYMNQLLGKGA
ncbi:MAG: sugar phosphate isomerase/epimerase [Gemmatimonadota bacterium]